jgi:hypothetical protein
LISVVSGFALSLIGWLAYEFVDLSNAHMRAADTLTLIFYIGVVLPLRQIMVRRHEQ